MKLDRIAAALEARTLASASGAEAADVTAGFVSDLLSEVLAHAPRGGLLVTVQAHLNVIAVAVHAELSAVIFAAGRQPETAVIERAMREKVALYVSDLTAFEIVGRLYELGLRGKA